MGRRDGWEGGLVRWGWSPGYTAQGVGIVEGREGDVVDNGREGTASTPMVGILGHGDKGGAVGPAVVHVDDGCLTIAAAAGRRGDGLVTMGGWGVAAVEGSGSSGVAAIPPAWGGSRSTIAGGGTARDEIIHVDAEMSSPFPPDHDGPPDEGADHEGHKQGRNNDASNGTAGQSLVRWDARGHGVVRATGLGVPREVPGSAGDKRRHGMID